MVTASDAHLNLPDPPTRIEDGEIRRLLDEARAAPMKGSAGMTTHRADELIAEARAERDARRA